MHPTGYSKELDRDLEYEENITKLEDVYRYEITFKDKCIEELNAKVEELEDVIDELSQTWYIKLWNSIPKISISIIRRK